MESHLLIVFLLLLLLAFAHSKYITSTDGNMVKCQDIQTQPAFRNDLLQNHTIQLLPLEIPAMIQTNKKTNWPTTEARIATADCPIGTVPVKYEKASNLTTRANTNFVHEYGVVYTVSQQILYGAKAIINVWDPSVEQTETEKTSSQIWISSGDPAGSNKVDTMEVGWMVDPLLYKDEKPRLFIYWTSDSYNNTGCYNLQCGGFVQTNRNIVLGGAITPISVIGGRQSEITILVWKDPEYGNWWLGLGPENIPVGYWPSELFTSLRYADKVVWGGEVLGLDRHSTTEMGSGRYPHEGFSYASYFRNLEIVGNNNSFEPVKNLEKHADQYFDVKILKTDEWGTHFFYGGPGFRQTRSGVTSLGSTSFLIYLGFSIFIVIYF